jgi:hypothetical protein
MQIKPLKTTKPPTRSTIGSEFESRGVHFFSLIGSELRGTLGFSVANHRSKSLLFSPAWIALPVPVLALGYERFMFSWIAAVLAAVCLSMAFWKVFSLGMKIRRRGESRRLSRWWERRGYRWSRAQREGFRP